MHNYERLEGYTLDTTQDSIAANNNTNISRGNFMFGRQGSFQNMRQHGFVYKESGVSFFMITFNCLSSYGLEEQIEKEE